MSVAEILAAIRAAADPRATVELYGSSVYAPAHASDVDALVSGDDPARLAAALGFALLPTVPPRLHGAIDGMPVDITIVAGDDRMRSGPRDAAMLAEYLRSHDRDDAFQAAWPYVRRFVKARALGHNGLGWFGSFGWAILLAVPLVTEPALRVASIGAVIPGWLRWLARLGPGSRVDLAGLHGGDPAPFFLAAPSPPSHDVARLSKRAAGWLFAEARQSLLAIGDAATDAESLERTPDLAAAPPPGATLVVTFEDERGRGRYDGTARGLIRDLEAMCACRSWGRFDTDADGAWQHRITVPPQRKLAAKETIEQWLSHAHIDATVE